MVAERAEKAGAVVLQESEAIAPITESGLVRGAQVKRKSEGGRVEEIAAVATFLCSAQAAYVTGTRATLPSRTT